MPQTTDESPGRGGISLPAATSDRSQNVVSDSNRASIISPGFDSALMASLGNRLARLDLTTGEVHAHQGSEADITGPTGPAISAPAPASFLDRATATGDAIAQLQAWYPTMPGLETWGNPPPEHFATALERGYEAVCFHQWELKGLNEFGAVYNKLAWYLLSRGVEIPSILRRRRLGQRSRPSTYPPGVCRGDIYCDVILKKMGRIEDSELTELYGFPYNMLWYIIVVMKRDDVRATLEEYATLQLIPSSLEVQRPVWDAMRSFARLWYQYISSPTHLTTLDSIKESYYQSLNLAIRDAKLRTAHTGVSAMQG